MELLLSYFLITTAIGIAIFLIAVIVAGVRAVAEKVSNR